MPTITLSKKELTKNLKKKLSLSELKDRISFLGTDLESIEGDNITVEIFPNRPDLLSQQGFTRAFSSFVGESVGLQHYTAKKSNHHVKVEEAVSNVRPYTACAIVKGLHITDQRIKDIVQIQEKLHITYGRHRKRCAIGIYPLEHITLPITYTARKPSDITFQPLEAKKEMTGAQILGAHPAGREYGHLLEGLEKYPIFVDAKGSILSMPPIINSYDTGRITETTKEVFVECSGFAWHVVSGALNMVVTALADMGGIIEEMSVDYPKSLGGPKKSPELTPRELPFEKSYIEKYIGYSFTDKDIITHLGHMGIGAQKKGKSFIAKIPSYRMDILHPIDLVEDVAIAYGLENVEAVIPQVSTIAKENDVEQFTTKLRQILTGHKLIEIKNYNITSKYNQSVLGEETIEVSSPASKEYNTLRKGLLPVGLKTLQENKHHEYPQNLFEIGETFHLDTKEETHIREEQHLIVLLCEEQAEYTAIRQILDSLLEALGVKGTIQPTMHPLCIDGRTGTIVIGKKEIGFLGEIRPQILETFELTMPVAVLELNVETLYSLLK